MWGLIFRKALYGDFFIHVGASAQTRMALLQRELSLIVLENWEVEDDRDHVKLQD